MPSRKTAWSSRLGGWIVRQPRVVSRAAVERAEVALTFDDGPSPWTAGIAATFAAHGCVATFFLRGPAVSERPATAAALAAAGHELGNHLWSHASPRGQSRAEIRAEVRRTAAAIRDACGVSPRLIRPPYCHGPGEVARAARGTGARMVVLRSLASADWNASSPDEIVGPLLAAVEPGDIVGLHDGLSPDERDGETREPTLLAIERLVPALLGRGLRPVTVSHLLR